MDDNEKLVSASGAAAGWSAAVMNKTSRIRRKGLCCADHDSSPDFTSTGNSSDHNHHKEINQKKIDKTPVFVKLNSIPKTPNQEPSNVGRQIELKQNSSTVFDYETFVSDSEDAESRREISFKNSKTEPSPVLTQKMAKQFQQPQRKQHQLRHILTESSNNVDRKQANVPKKYLQSMEKNHVLSDERIVRQFRIQYKKSIHERLAESISHLRSIVNKSGCTIRLHDSLLLKKVSPYGPMMKYLLFSLESKQLNQMKTCLKLLERLNPIFLERKECTNNAKTILLWNKYVPENSNLVFFNQRFNHRRHSFGELSVVTVKKEL